METVDNEKKKKIIRNDYNYKSQSIFKWSIAADKQILKKLLYVKKNNLLISFYYIVKFLFLMIMNRVWKKK